MLNSLSRSLVFAAFVVGLASVAAPTFAGGSGGSGTLTPGGTLTLRTGNADQWVLEQNAVVTNTQAVGASTLSGEKCFLTPKIGSLVNTSASGQNQPGFVGDSIGVWGGGNSGTARGTACSRVSGAEALSLTLGAGLSGLKVSNTRLDIEVKQNAKVVATAKLAGQTVASFELRSGSSIVTGQGSTNPGSPIFNCTARSDSGPDSGSSDNCTWAFQALYDTLDLTAAVGEFSLEGGGDWGSSAAQNYSQFDLVEADGVLACGDTVSESANGTTTAVTRLATSCNTLLPYSLANRPPGTGGFTIGSFEFLTPSGSPNDQQFVMEITWPAETAPQTAPALQNIALSAQSFDGITEYPVDLCVGIPTYSGGVLTGLAHGQDLDGNAANGSQYGCEISHTLDYVGDEIIQLRQVLFVEGDFLAGRK